MRAVQLAARDRLETVEVPVPEPGDDEVLVRAHRGSICGSDLHIIFDGFYRGEFPAAPGFPGHEGVGDRRGVPLTDFAPGTPCSSRRCRRTRGASPSGRPS